MSGRRLLIVNADDFGRSPGINRGIVQAHNHGIVTSTTLMVNTPWLEDAVQVARATPSLAVGLHLNFCYGTPLSAPVDIPSLVTGNGDFITDVDALDRQATSVDIQAEALAQLKRFQEVVGRCPTHIDSHKYTHSRPRIAPMVAEFAASIGLPARALDAVDRALLRLAGVATPDSFEGRFHGLDGEGVETELLVRAIRASPEGVTELMCHPGIVDEHLRDSSYREDRECEIEALCSQEARRALEECGVSLATYLDI